MLRSMSLLFLNAAYSSSPSHKKTQINSNSTHNAHCPGIIGNHELRYTTLDTAREYSYCTRKLVKYRFQ